MAHASGGASVSLAEDGKHRGLPHPCSGEPCVRPLLGVLVRGAGLGWEGNYRPACGAAFGKSGEL